MRRLSAALAALLLAGCAQSPVQPWEKGALAQPNMRFDANRVEGRFAAHTYDSREAAFGAGSVGGGGCGCN
ncbi:DUF4266 domain-containing protein [Pseudoduganella sp. DS3]|uniref:DUF4266 domain-containing protein n=1 Tax=Pseudoduganella guangdongensis TaxID=2692179 RepID=A0A6N9HQD7_9BURK|nr:DUF4266 domain-containing protein [Pseudoduganella guangdongensis]MYN05032.1 DUF4266 domain-containing protein [Pseudoduganella guangdongensis]